jgi:signal transduction histidine kinase
VHWVGTVSGLLRETGASFSPVRGIHATVRVLRQSSDGALWIGTIGEGLWVYKDGRFTRVDGGLLPTSTVLSIFEDRGHNLWIGTQDGLVRLERTPVSLVPLPRDHDSDFGTISRDWGSESWMVANGVYRIRDNVAQPFTFEQLPGIPVRNVLRARDGSLWIGTDGSGAYHLSGATMTHYAAPEQLTNNFVRAFLETARGDVWIATDEGVSRVGPGTVRKYGMRDGLAYFSTRSMLEDRSHDVWIGTDQGLSHIHNDHFVRDAATAALAQEKVWSILQDHSGALWFGTRDHGLFRLKDNQIEQYTMANGLVNDSVYQILEDRERRLWLSGGDTISSVDIADLGSAPQRIGGLLSVTSYKMPFAAANAQLYGGRQPAGYVASDDTVWFATSGGAAHVVPQRVQPERPAVYLESVVADSRQLAAGAGLRVAAQVSRLTFSFAPLLLSSQEGLRFRYKLDGFDKSWSATGISRSATYTNLPAGDYRFRVEVLDIAHPELTAEAELTFSKAPHLYQRWWFLAGCVICIAGLVWSIYRFRVQQMQNRFRAVLEERNRLAREMHDTVIQGCASTSALLEALASLQPAEDAPGSDLLGCARIQIRTTIDEARDAVWNLRHDGSAEVDLATALHSVAHQAARAFGMAVDCRIAAGLPRVAASAGHELLMIVREAFANAGLHAHAEQVQFDAVMKGPRLHISITDNGIGFAPAEAPGASDGHFGLTGMRERMKRLGGTIQIGDAPPLGTRVQLCLRCATPQRRLINHWRKSHEREE